MTPEEIQLCREYFQKKLAGAVGLLAWIHEMRPIPWDDSPADAEEELLETLHSAEFELQCLDLIELGEELPPSVAERFFGQSG